jgi:cell division ATPase FtsA
MKLPLFNKTKKQDLFTVVDLGTTHVKAAVFKSASEFEDRKLLGLGVQPQGNGSLQAGRVIDLDAVVETLSLALEEADLKAGLSSPQLILGLSGDAIYAKGIKVRIHRQDPSNPLEEKEFNLLADQIESQTLEKARDELEKRYRVKLERVETSFTSYFLDGARVKTPLGLSGSGLEVAVLHYFIEPNTLQTINHLVDQVELEIISLVGTTVHYAAHLMNKYTDFVLIDLGGEVTQIVLVRGGKVIDQIIFLMGSADLVKKIESDLEVGHTEAENLKRDYLLGHLDEDRAAKIKKSLNESVGHWVEGVASQLGNAELGQIPNHFIISGGNRFLNEVKINLASYGWNKELNIEGFPKIEIVSEKYADLYALADLEV